MSGLLVRFGEPLAKMVCAMRVPNTPATFTANGSPGLSRNVGSIDLPSVSLAAPAQPVGELADRLIS
jgi:hypothetical protein